MSETKKCGCEEFFDLRECFSCLGTGEDVDDSGPCPFCGGRGEREVIETDYTNCIEDCFDDEFFYED